MKITFSAIICAALALSGCSGPGAASKNVPAATLEQVPPGYYRIDGAVRHPGLIKCQGDSESLMTVISRADGLTDFAFRRKVRVICNGATNYFNVSKILRGETADPAVPCGATIWITRRVL